MNVFILTRTQNYGGTNYGGTQVVDVFASEYVAEQEQASYARLNPRDEFDLIEMEVTE